MGKKYSMQEQIQINEIQFLLKQQSISREDALIKLREVIPNENEATQTLKNIIDGNRTEAFIEVTQKTEKNANAEIGFGMIVGVNAFSGAFVENLYIKLFVVILSGIAGYYFFKDKPVSGVVGAVLFSILFPFAHAYYFSGRSRFIRIELVIPLLIAGMPAILTSLFINSILYGNRDE